MPAVDLLVVAGGAALRLGGVDKALLRRPDGRTVLAALLAAPVDGRRVVVGPERAVDGVDVWAREDPPGGGPVAGIAAGLTHLDAAIVVVLAGDLPYGAEAVPALLAALPGHDVAVVVADDRPQWLLSAWQVTALRAALTRLGDPVGARVGALYQGADAVRVPDRGPADRDRGERTGGGREQWSRDLDTPADLERLLDHP